MFRLPRALSLVLLAACSTLPQQASDDYDVLITDGLVYDGTGAPPRRLDVAITGDRVAALLEPGSGARARLMMDAQGQAVAPGFINVLSWATESLIVDPRGMSDTKQGVTLEIFGEGWSMGPLNQEMKAEALKRQGDIRYPIEWTTLGEYLEYLEQRGVTPNIASFVGATTVRMHELGEEDRPPTSEELERMRDLVRQAMREGALGVGASLIYAPAFYAQTEELIALAQAAGEYGGGYIAHMRSEANRLLEAIDETIRIAREAGVRAEVYHFKAAGEANWPKMSQAIAKIEAARAEGLPISADMYAYTAGATGLDGAMPPWVQEGGHDAWVARLRDPEIRARVIREMQTPSDDWENLYLLAGSPDRIQFIGFKNEKLKPLTGKTLAEVAAQRGTSPEDTIIDLVIEDDSRVGTAYFLMSEENVELGLSQPWVSLGSDAESSAPEGVFLKSSAHPRAYGNVARFLVHYVRDRELMPLAEAIRRLTRLPAKNWKLDRRGCLDPGCYADVVVFDPETIRDHATFEEPLQYATGVAHVFVNGVQVLRDGEHTGATPGRVVRGPGWGEGSGDADAFVAWARRRAIPLPGDDVQAAAEPLGRLAAGIGSARVVALGEHAHGAHEPLDFRNRLFRHGVGGLGFTAIALESGLSESRRVHDFVMGGAGDAREIARTGLTWGFGDYAENLELIRWLRAANAGRGDDGKIRFYGIDLSGGVAGELPGARIALEDALAYLARAAPRASQRVRGAAEPFVAAFTREAYAALPEREQRRLRQSVEDVIAFLENEREDLIAASSQEDYDWGYRNAIVARQIEGMFRVWPREMPEDGIAPELHEAMTVRDAAMADNLLWALEREGPSGRVLLFAHNAHVANTPVRGGLWSVFPEPPTMMGQHLRQKLAEDLLIVLTSSSSDGSELPVETTQPGTVDAALSRMGLPSFWLDIRGAQSPAPVARWLDDDQSVRVNFNSEVVLKPRDSFDAIVYFNDLTPAESLADESSSPQS